MKVYVSFKKKNSKEAVNEFIDTKDLVVDSEKLSDIFEDFKNAFRELEVENEMLNEKIEELTEIINHNQKVNNAMIERLLKEINKGVL